jgi:hypothetical protein
MGRAIQRDRRDHARVELQTLIHGDDVAVAALASVQGDGRDEILQVWHAVVVEGVRGRFPAEAERTARRSTRVDAITREIRVRNVIPDEQNAERTIRIAAGFELIAQIGRC